MPPNQVPNLTELRDELKAQIEHKDKVVGTLKQKEKLLTSLHGIKQEWADDWAVSGDKDWRIWEEGQEVEVREKLDDVKRIVGGMSEMVREYDRDIARLREEKEKVEGK